MEVTKEFIKEMEPYVNVPEGSDLFSTCSQNLIHFCRKMLGVSPYAWQVYAMIKIMKAMRNRNNEIRLDESVCGDTAISVDGHELVFITSRQIGKSTFLAWLSVWLCVFNKLPSGINHSTSIIVVSASDVQAKKLLYEVKKVLKTGDRFMKEKYGDELTNFFEELLDEHEPNNMTTITFKPHDEENMPELVLGGSKVGSTIKSYPPTSSVLGETASAVFVDEAGKTDKITDQFFYDFLYPVGNSTSALRVYTSTPWVTSGFFYRMVDPDSVHGDSGVDCSTFTIDAIKIENLDYYNNVMKIVDQQNRDGSTGAVQRAYYCRFVQGESNYFNPEKVFDTFDSTLSLIPSFEGECDMGVDFGGKVKSKSVITVTTLNDDGEIIRLYDKVYAVNEDESLMEDIAEIMKVFNIQRVIPDDCPQGAYLIRDMIDKGWDVHPMNFRSDKVKKYGAFRSLLNRGMIKSYEDEALRTEMLAMEHSSSSKQSVIQHAPGYSDDLIDSFVMSAYFYLDRDDEVCTFDWDDMVEDSKFWDKNIIR